MNHREGSDSVTHTWWGFFSFFPTHKICQNKLPIGCYTRLLHVQHLHACCFAESRSSVKSFHRQTLTSTLWTSIQVFTYFHIDSSSHAMDSSTKWGTWNPGTCEISQEFHKFSFCNSVILKFLILKEDTCMDCTWCELIFYSGPQSNSLSKEANCCGWGSQVKTWAREIRTKGLPLPLEKWQFRQR